MEMTAYEAYRARRPLAWLAALAVLVFLALRIAGVLPDGGPFEPDQPTPPIQVVSG